MNLFFHTDQGVEGVGIVIRDNNMAGKVWTRGFNVSEQILDLIDQGIILVTINQGFDNQAEAAVTRLRRLPGRRHPCRRTRWRT